VVLSVLVIKGRKSHQGHQCTCQGSYSSKWFPTFEVSNHFQYDCAYISSN
jgi:hypothetical protein